MNTAPASLAAPEVGQLVRVRDRQLADTGQLAPHLVELSSVEDGAAAKLAALVRRKPGDPHPFVIGDATIQRYLTMVRECAQAGLAASR